MKADKGFFFTHILTMHIHAKGLDTPLDKSHKRLQLINDADSNHYPNWDQFLQRFLPIHDATLPFTFDFLLSVHGVVWQRKHN